MSAASMADLGCPDCVRTSLQIGETKRDIVRLIRSAEKRPGTPLAEGCRTQIAEKRELLATLKAMRRECCGEVAP